MKNKITISGIRAYAFHGCLAAEALTGALYSTDVEVETDFLQAAEKDELAATVDYGRIAEIVRSEMSVRSRLIENVALRIHRAVKREFPGAEKVAVRVSKLAPAVEGAADRATVEIAD